MRYPAYRRYSEARIAVNDAMMALLIGARLGEHALGNSAASPSARLPELFGRIEGIQRLNRTAGDAAVLLARAEEHLVHMAILQRTRSAMMVAWSLRRTRSVWPRP